MNKNVCLYHANCVDGFTAAWVVKSALPECELIPVNYGEPLPSVEKYSKADVYIVDFSYPPEELAIIAHAAKTVVMLDHHKSAIDKWEGEKGYFKLVNGNGMVSWGDNVRIVFDLNRSGAKLAWDHFFPNTPTPLLVQYVQDRDLWKWEMPASKEVSAFIRGEQMTIESWNYLNEIMTPEVKLNKAIMMGGAILRREQQVIEKAVKNAVKVKIAGFTVPVVNATELISEIGNELCKGQPFAAMYFDDLKHGVRRWSLRSKDDGEDVAKIAERFGGGGHKNAAGYEVPLIL